MFIGDWVKFDGTNYPSEFGEYLVGVDDRVGGICVCKMYYDKSYDFFHYEPCEECKCSGYQDDCYYDCYESGKWESMILKHIDSQPPRFYVIVDEYEYGKFAGYHIDFYDDKVRAYYSVSKDKTEELLTKWIPVLDEKGRRRVNEHQRINQDLYSLLQRWR